MGRAKTYTQKELIEFLGLTRQGFLYRRDRLKIKPKRLYRGRVPFNIYTEAHKKALKEYRDVRPDPRD